MKSCTCYISVYKHLVSLFAMYDFQCLHTLFKLLTKTPFIYNIFFLPDLTNSIYLKIQDTRYKIFIVMKFYNFCDNWKSNRKYKTLFAPLTQFNFPLSSILQK